MRDIAGAKASDRVNYDVVIIGGGAAGITVAAELLKHRSTLTVAIVEPSESHAYQPGWTLVGDGVFSKEQKIRCEAGLIPKRATWIKAAARTLEPATNSEMLSDNSSVKAVAIILH